MIEPDLDVAISFCSEDLELAKALRTGLREWLRIFEFTDRQEELAGTDGLDSLRAVFRSRARLVVILLREKWGQTPWTRVEMEAITDRFLHEGPEFLFVVTTDEGAVRPKWLPDKLLRFNVQEFPVSQAIGAVKLRVTDLGGAFTKLSTIQRARLAEERIAFQRRRAQLRESYEGVRAAQEEAKRIFQLMDERVTELKSTSASLGLEHGVTESWGAVRTDGVAVHVQYRNNIVNSLSEARLIIRDLRGSVLLPGQGGSYLDAPKALDEKTLLPDIFESGSWGWRDEEDRMISTEDVAEHCVERVISLIERAAAGELPRLW